VRAGVLVGVLLLTYQSSEEFVTYAPAPETGFYAERQVEITPVELPSGLVVNTPTGQPPNQQCFGAALPCTSAGRVNDNLELRTPGDLSSGFRDLSAETCH